MAHCPRPPNALHPATYVLQSPPSGGIAIGQQRAPFAFSGCPIDSSDLAERVVPPWERTMRDDFTEPTKETLARRVNYLCSNPDCPLGTVGPHTDAAKSVNKGVAAHITAAAPGGKRYDGSLTADERSSPANGIWLCQNCAKLIDSDEDRFTVALLREWKAKAEAAVRQSLESNSPLASDRGGPDLRIRASYAGGPYGSYVDMQIFNARPTPIYLSSWFATWEDKRGTTSATCVRGNLPFRLQGQDQHQIVVDVGEGQINGLKMVGVLDGTGRWWSASEVEVAVIVQCSQRYDSLRPKRDTTEIEERLKQCDIEIGAAIKHGPAGRKRLEIIFTNKSAIPIQLGGAEIKWEYDPPRWQPIAPDSKARVAQAGGSVNLACSSSLESPIAPGDTAVFFVHDDIAGVLVETILGDVKDEDIKVVVYTDTQLGWSATADEIPETVREMARHIVEFGRGKTRH